MRISEGLRYFYLSMTGVLSPATIDFYKKRLPSLVEFLGDIELGAVTVDDLRAWRAALVDRDKRCGHGHKAPQRDVAGTKRPGKLSIHSIDQHVRAARRFFRWCYLESRIDRNPAQRLERPTLPQHPRSGIPRADLDRMLAYAQCIDDLRELAMLRFLADTACRLAGIAALCLADLDIPHRRAVVREKGRGGNNKTRKVFFTPTTAESLTAWLKERPETADPHVFVGIAPGHYGKPLSASGIGHAVNRVALACGIHQGANPHSFRHGAIRGWLNQGMPLSKASQLAGHSSVKVTGDIYGTSDEEELAQAQAHDRYSWVD